MIRVHRINQTPFMLNCDLIEAIEETPDTVVNMTSGRKFIVAESADALRRLVIEFKHSILMGHEEQEGNEG